VGYLIDTNVLSELRKGQRCHGGVAAWFASVKDGEIFLSVLVIGEIRRGIELIRRRDPPQAVSLEAWLRSVETRYGARILLISRDVAEAWGRLSVPDRPPVVDALLAATALVHGHTLVTRNTRDVARTGAALLNPFDPPASPGAER
jgi:predicted nucleic acid-binding protein